MEIGNSYLFLTLSFYWTGRIVALTPTEIVIEEAAQVFDTGELEKSLTAGTVNLCQAIPDGVKVTLPRAGTTALTWKHPLIRKSKRD